MTTAAQRDPITLDLDAELAELLARRRRTVPSLVPGHPGPADGADTSSASSPRVDFAGAPRGEHPTSGSPTPSGLPDRAPVPTSRDRGAPKPTGGAEGSRAAGASTGEQQ